MKEKIVIKAGRRKLRVCLMQFDRLLHQSKLVYSNGWTLIM